MRKSVIRLVIAYRHDIRRQQVHYLYRREALELAVDQRAAEHVSGDGIDDILLLVADLIDISGQARNSPYELVVHLLCEEIPVKVVGMQQCQFFQILHIIIPLL